MRICLHTHTEFGGKPCHHPNSVSSTERRSGALYKRSPAASTAVELKTQTVSNSGLGKYFAFDIIVTMATGACNDLPG